MASSLLSIPKQMRAQQLHAFNQPYGLASNVPVPTPTDPDDVLIRVDAASYCHTDAVLAAGQMPPFPLAFPHVGCHEFAGTVVAHAEHPSQRAAALRPATRVGVPGRPVHPCGECDECTKKAGNPQDNDDVGSSTYCPRALNNGIGVDGGFREYAVVDARQVAPLPDSITAVDAAPLMCAGVTIYAGLQRCQPELGPGGRVGIVGCGGGLGHLGLQFASKMGYRVVGVESNDGPLALAKGLGLSPDSVRIVDARKESADQIVEDVGSQDRKTDRGSMGLDAVIILPESQAAFDYGMKLLRDHGKCLVLSFPEKGFHLSARDLIFRDISVVGSLVGSNKVLREMLDFAAKNDIKAEKKIFPLSQLNELVELYHRGEGGKLVVDLSLERG